MPGVPFDLKERAREIMIEAGFEPELPGEVVSEAAALSADAVNEPAAPVHDLRQLLWSSIDNDESRDLDQIEYAERLPDSTIRLLIGIADVAASVPKSSAIDAYAAGEATSVYTGVRTFPMLPPDLSTNRTSLLDSGDRNAVVVELRVQADGAVGCHDIFFALVRNRAKLTYGAIGEWLEGRGAVPDAVARVPGMAEQLQLQLEASGRLRALRKRQGALTFGSVEPTPVTENGIVKGLAVKPHTVADDLIESFMVAANVAMAQHLREHGQLAIRRVVRTPKSWDRIVQIAAQFQVTLPGEPDPRALSDFLEQRRAADPGHFPDLSLSIVKLLGPGEYTVETPGAEREGHFGLAVQDYSHSTAPNRRYADLVMQRLLKAATSGRSDAYTEPELRAIAAHCTEREDAARKVERRMRKVIAADLLRDRIGEVFDGIVTGASPKGTYVRLLRFPAEGRIVSGATGLDVGDGARVRLVSVNVPQGFIDFDRL